MKKICSKLLRIIQIIVSMFKWKKCIPVVSTIGKDSLLSGKVALIVGGSGGIGYAIAKSFVASGCKVVLAGTNEAKLKKLSSELSDCSYLTINLTDITSFEEKVSAAVNLFGSIDILVCSSGVHVTRNGFDFGSVLETEYDKIMNINLKGTYFISQTVANYMKKNHVKGHILLISSNRGIEPAWSPYSLSKLALNGFTAGMAKKLIPHGIVVNAIAPGPTATTMQEPGIAGSIYTEQTPIERYTMPEEVAEYAKMMVSSLGDTIVGDTIYMTGGRGIIEQR